jgi:hypothetical protein
MRTIVRWVFLAAVLHSVSCAGTIAAPRTAPSARPPDALLVLPGFGYSAAGERALRRLAPGMRADGVDLYLPDYVARRGLEASRRNLQRFVRDQRLERYERVHVFAFIAGGWTFNPLAEDSAFLRNLASVVYDRSPYQERAPRIAAQKLGPLAWLRYGGVLFDVASTPYPPLPRPGVKVGLLVETEPTPFVKRFARTAQSYGPYAFDCDSLGQAFDDCMFVAMNHSQLYPQFGDVWPEVRAFIRNGRFTDAANRTPPDGVNR